LYDGDIVDVLTVRLDRLMYHLKVLVSSYHIDLSHIEETTRELIDILGKQSVTHSGYITDIMHTGTVGAPKIAISKEQLKYFIDNGFTIHQISSMINVSTRTIKRRLREFDIKIKEQYTTISDFELDRIIETILKDFPNTGYKRMKGFLISRNLRVQEYRVRESMRRVDPEGVILRALQCTTVIRRAYNVKGPLSLWHMDGNHKLIM